MTRLLPFLGILVLCAAPASAQPIDGLPEEGGNSRFFADRFPVGRPSLSINGFSCERAGTCDRGRGLAEVLKAVYGPEPDADLVALWSSVVSKALSPPDYRGGDRDRIIDNTRRLQSAMTLLPARILADANGWEDGLPPGYEGTIAPVPSSADLMRLLRGHLGVPESVLPDADLSDDAIKWTMPVANLARAVDLYLGAERAAEGLSQAAVPLLSCDEKHALLVLLDDAATEIDRLGNLQVVGLLSRDEVQAGNWPMKTHVATGYASLASQETTAASCGDLPERPHRHWVERALRSAAGPTDRDRNRHWHYQTEGGEPTFAEGPYYFHLALSEIVPFWHAIRASDLLGFHPEFDVPDPFRSDWFLQPLRWLAATAAPDGTTPPLDDGNRAVMDHASALAWAEPYGDEGLSASFRWIADFGGDDPDLLPVLLGMPRVAERDPPPEGLTVVGPHGRPQQAVVRLTDLQDRAHYLLLNAESGDSIRRGEGHEQADQLQLIYYVDGLSALMDSGYDDAVGLANSSWNHYFDHNVLTLDGGGDNGEGGLKAPRLDLLAGRITSRHPSADLRAVEIGGLTMLRASVPLYGGDNTSGTPDAVYERHVIVVGDPDRPYMIDVNRASEASDTTRFLMRYHGGSDEATLAGSRATWNLANGTSFEIQVLPADAQSLMVAEDTARERFEEDVDIRRLDVLSETGRVVSIISTHTELPTFDRITDADGYWAAWPDGTIDVVVLGDERRFAVAGASFARTGEGPAFIRFRTSEGAVDVDHRFRAGADHVGSVGVGSISTGPDGLRGVEKPYPNPFDDVITLSVPADADSVEVFDLIGRRVASIPVTGPTVRFGRRLPAGVYVVTVRSAGRIALMQTVVKRGN